jgi:hypothetical protein
MQSNLACSPYREMWLVTVSFGNSGLSFSTVVTNLAKALPMANSLSYFVDFKASWTAWT